MLRKTIKYEDFDGNKRTEVHYFNLMKNELLDLAIELPGGVTNALSEGDVTNIDEKEAASRMFSALGNNGLYNFIKLLVDRSYGIKSADGRKIEKSEEILKDFKQTLAYEALMMELLDKNGVAATEFMNNVIPKNLVEDMIKAQNTNAVVPRV